MGLEVYYPTDIRNALLAAEQAANATATAVRPAHDGATTGNQDDPFSAGFLTGYQAALTTLAVAFGLVPGCQKTQALADDVSTWRPTLLAGGNGRR
jgi:branched-subunit amino acid permease